MTKEFVLKKYFGYDQFRPQQAEIIDHVLSGRDCLVLMPTGGGKSVCYQVPALLLPGIAVVISPLIALMRDQVDALRAIGIPAAYLNSSLSPSEQSQVLADCLSEKIKLLYVAPERLFSGGTMDMFRNFRISLFAVDESHCISSWGHDFRPEYRQLTNLRPLFPGVPFVALTATADRATRKDILVQLGIPEEHVFLASFDRPNLTLQVQAGRNRLQQIRSFVEGRAGQPGIIYCISRKSTETVAARLQEWGLRADYYHAGCPNEHRTRVQQLFIRDDLQIMVATIAFGMGIDKPNIRWVIHYNLPGNVESYYQEIGRAGRDGLPSETILFFSLGDIFVREDMIANSAASDEQKEVWRAKLDRMRQYAQADFCRRRVLLSYFNEHHLADCGNCDVCRNPRTRFDASVLAQKALSGIARTQEKVGLSLLTDLLRGSRNQSILQAGYHQLPTYGVGKDLKTEEWHDYLLQMLNQGVMDIAYDDAHTFKLNPLSWRILRGQEKVWLVKPSDKKEVEEMHAPEPPSARQQLQQYVFDALRALRKQLADQQGVPPYVVFSDATIKDMAKTLPVNLKDIAAISGVGEMKLQRYGQVFAEKIRDTVRAFNALSSAEQDAYGTTAQLPGVRQRNIPPAEAASQKPVRVKGMTYEETFLLYEQGLDVEGIAAARSLSPTTIAGHLVKLHFEGRGVELTRFLSVADRDKILSAARSIRAQTDSEPNGSSLDEWFQGAYTPWQVRMALNWQAADPVLGKKPTS